MPNTNIWIESRDDFGKPCPRCGQALADHTLVDQDKGYLFFRTWFRCTACDYWLCTRREGFNTVGPIGDEASEAPVVPSEREQRVRLHLTQTLVSQLMPGGVESYQCGHVWASGETEVSKTWTKFSIGGLHLVLAGLGTEYFERGDLDLAICAYELAAQEIRSSASIDPTLSKAVPDNCYKAARILMFLAFQYHDQGRIDLADGFVKEALTWKPDLFDDDNEA